MNSKTDIQNIQLVLIGPMGAGKSTVGRELAKLIGCPFTDTDELIEKDQGKSISDIFIEDGEPHFRLVEESVVIDALNDLNSTNGVLALGGGSIMSEPVQIEIEKSPAKKVFLDISLSSVSSRVGFDKARPLLMVNPRQKWSELMSARRATYEKLADLTIDVSDLTPEQVAKQIVSSL